jgi:transposase InsO family protein
MGRIDRSNGQDATMERRHINAMLRNIAEYESVKRKAHKEFRTAQEFYEAKGICKQNFLKYYRRYLIGNRDIESLLPHKTGRKFRNCLTYETRVIDKIEEIRRKGYNKFDIVSILKTQETIEISASSVYRLMKRLGINRLNLRIKEEKKRIIKMEAGELGHIDIHYVTKGTVKELGNKKLYILGLIDDYSRICWLEVIDSIKSIDVMFATQEIMGQIKRRYEIGFKEMMSDNGSEFASRNNPQHPFERMLKFYDIKHRYTKPCRPQTNGKIERFWKTLENELLDGEVFETIEEFKHYILGYIVYYNEHRMHQGISNKIPIKMIA